MEESLSLKGVYLIEHNADILVMGDDWEGEFDELNLTAPPQCCQVSISIMNTRLTR